MTAADVRTEKILREELGKARPDFGFNGGVWRDKRK